ncbi:MAG: valine--tRNA ligase [Pseudomonadota bacterium]
MLEKTYDAAAVEPGIAKLWDEANAFRAGANAKDGEDSFAIVIPPPNVTGSLHMGHALNNTLQDVLIRFERMRGKNVLWQPGMDHAGIATQMVVERQLADQQIKRHDLGREAFIDKVWDWKAESGGMIFNQLKRLGASCDWSRERFTMDEGLSKAVLHVFVSLYREGLIYRGKRLVNWDPKFETAISDLEVENIEVDGHMWHFKYPLAGGETYTYVEKNEDGEVLLEEERDYISIATTRPETMLGDGAVAVHPTDERYAPIIGKLCEIPVGPKEHRRLIPIITDDYPDPEFGSGAVKITGAHDFNDYAVAKRNAIPPYRLMDEKAAMRNDGEPYAQAAKAAMDIVNSGELPDEKAIDSINLVPDEFRGLDRFEARKRVVADIDAEGLMIEIEDKKVMQPFGDRSNVVIEPMLTDQWFADAKVLAEPAIASVKEGRTKFVPKSWENTYYNWMENIEPWCISRQLWWGHRIPAWYGPDDRIFVASSADEAEAEARAHYGEDVDLRRDEDVLDTWFSSALWPFSTLGWPDQTKELETYYQTDVLVTAFDIIFFWVARMMMMGLHFMKDEDGNPVEPFHTVYIHALVRDKDGQKMSKSKGNVIDPLELIDAYGADALRFTLAIMAAQGRDVKLDTSRVEGYRNFGTKLWNATRFGQMNGVARSESFDPNSTRAKLNRWILSELSVAIAEISDGIEKFRFNDAAAAAYRFVWNTYCDWYLELLKPVFSSDDENAKAESQSCAGYVLDQIYKLLHPFMPFMTEELWAKTGGTGLLCHAAWPEAPLSDTSAASEINWLIELVTSVRSVKAEMNIKPSMTLPLVIVNASEETRARVERQMAAIQRLARIESVAHADSAPEASAQIVLGETTLCLPLAGYVDFSDEIARLEKELAGLEKDINQNAGKLKNEKFVANAPETVVAETRERLTDAENKKSKVLEALERVKSFA